MVSGKGWGPSSGGGGGERSSGVALNSCLVVHAGPVQATVEACLYKSRKQRILIQPLIQQARTTVLSPQPSQGAERGGRPAPSQFTCIAPAAERFPILAVCLVVATNKGSSGLVRLLLFSIAAALLPARVCLFCFQVFYARDNHNLIY